MNKSFDPKRYWEERIDSHPNLHGTGHRSFDLNYNQYLYKTQKDCLDEILVRWKIQVDGKRVLDIGSGTGFFVEYFHNLNAGSITGLDLTQSSIDFLEQKYPELTFLTIDISNENVGVQGNFDIISAMGVLYHIVEQVHFQKALKNLCNLLSPGGYLLITDSFTKSPFPSARHARLRPIDDYQTILSEYNVKILEILPLYYFSNRTYLPWIGPWILNTFKMGNFLYRLDRRYRHQGKSNGGGLKILLAKVESGS